MNQNAPAAATTTIGEHEPASGGFAARPQRRERRGHDRHHEQLTDFHADVKDAIDQPSARGKHILSRSTRAC